MVSKLLSFAALSFFSLLLANPATSHSVTFNEADYDPSHVVTKDFLVLGGGASGTYAAVRLKDHDKSVVLIERNNRLGGHTHTYIDPKTGGTSDFGVVIYQNFTTTINFFKRFDIPLTTFVGDGPLESKYADFATGKALPNYTLPDFLTGFKKYFKTLTPYPYLEYGWNLTYPVPEDLLMPFGDYVTKYGLEDAALMIFEYAQNQGNILDQPTIYVAKYFGLSNGDAFVNGYLSTARRNNSELYSKALEYLGSDVLLRSHILSLKRSDSGVRAVVSTPTGNKLIKAKKLVSSIPPILKQLTGWDLTDKEVQLFGQFNNSAYWTAIVTDTGLDNNISYTNIQLNAVLNIPRLPEGYNVSPTGSIKDVFRIYYGGTSSLPEHQIRNAMIKDINVVQKLQGVSMKEPKFLILEPHLPFQCAVTPNLIRKRFYEKLYSLQGKASTFWTGAAWHTHDSAMLWRFTESLLPTFLGQ
jgi:NAD(P)-binding Rossmann-like domain